MVLGWMQIEGTRDPVVPLTSLTWLSFLRRTCSEVVDLNVVVIVTKLSARTEAGMSSSCSPDSSRNLLIEGIFSRLSIASVLTKFLTVVRDLPSNLVLVCVSLSDMESLFSSLSSLFRTNCVLMVQCLVFDALVDTPDNVVS